MLLWEEVGRTLHAFGAQSFLGGKWTLQGTCCNGYCTAYVCWWGRCHKDNRERAGATARASSVDACTSQAVVIARWRHVGSVCEVSTGGVLPELHAREQPHRPCSGIRHCTCTSMMRGTV